MGDLLWGCFMDGGPRGPPVLASSKELVEWGFPEASAWCWHPNPTGAVMDPTAILAGGGGIWGAAA